MHFRAGSFGTKPSTLPVPTQQYVKPKKNIKFRAFPTRIGSHCTHIQSTAQTPPTDFLVLEDIRASRAGSYDSVDCGGELGRHVLIRNLRGVMLLIRCD